MLYQSSLPRNPVVFCSTEHLNLDALFTSVSSWPYEYFLTQYNTCFFLKTVKVAVLASITDRTTKFHPSPFE